METIVKDFIREIGFDESIVDENQENRVNNWLAWYKGKTKDYEYYVYNGKKKTKQILKSLNIVPQACGDLSDFFFNEKLDITIDNENVEDKIKEVLKTNHFNYNANKLMQLVKALGTGAFVTYLEDDVLKINYLNATNIVILENDNHGVKSVLFWNIENGKEGKILKINAHVLTDEGYVIYNREYNKDGENWVRVQLDDAVEQIETKSFIPRFAMLFTPEVNNKDINTPYGMSAYANALDNIIAIDRAYDTYDNEIWLGRKRVYVKGGATKFNIDGTGNVTPIFDASDTAYYQVPGDEKDPLITESSFDLRIDQIKNALQGQLNLFSGKIGLGHNYYKFQDGDVYVNTDNVISANSDIYRKIKKQENIITNAITDICYAIAELLGISDKFNVSVFYDDSIIEDTKEIRNQALTEYNAGLISKAQYARDVYKLGDNEALEFVEQMNKEIVEETITDGVEDSFIE